MSRARSLTLALALALPAALLAPLAAFGDAKAPAKAPARTGEDKYDADNITAISQYMETIAKGTERFLAKDPTGAIDTFRKAIQLNPRQPLAHYLLAEAYVAQNNLGEAEAAIAQAFEVDAKDAVMRSHVLFVRAVVFERQKKWDEAKAAWQAYTEQAAKVPADAGAFPQTGAERVRAIARRAELEAAYAGVRERIAAEKADAGAKASGSGAGNGKK